MFVEALTAPLHADYHARVAPAEALLQRAGLTKRNPLEAPMPATLIATPYGALDVDPAALTLGELVVTDDGVELEVTGLAPLRFEPAPEEAEDWGE
jgi:lysine biosynthesis protein LysW